MTEQEYIECTALGHINDIIRVLQWIVPDSAKAIKADDYTRVMAIVYRWKTQLEEGIKIKG